MFCFWFFLPLLVVAITFHWLSTGVGLRCFVGPQNTHIYICVRVSLCVCMCVYQLELIYMYIIKCALSNVEGNIVVRNNIEAGRVQRYIERHTLQKLSEDKTLFL